jgi:hypothetical protein
VARLGEEGSERLDQRLERVGGNVQGDGDVVPVGGEHAVAQAAGRGEPDGVEDPVGAVPPLGQRLPGGGELLGRGDVDLQHVGLGRELAGRPLGEGEGPGRPGQDDLRTLLLGQPGHGEGEGIVGEDTGDHEPLTVE